VSWKFLLFHGELRPGGGGLCFAVACAVVYGCGGAMGREGGVEQFSWGLVPALAAAGVRELGRVGGDD
jgi:hypothetical protein